MKINEDIFNIEVLNAIEKIDKLDIIFSNEEAKQIEEVAKSICGYSTDNRTKHIIKKNTFQWFAGQNAVAKKLEKFIVKDEIRKSNNYHEWEQNETEYGDLRFLKKYMRGGKLEIKSEGLKDSYFHKDPSTFFKFKYQQLVNACTPGPKKAQYFLITKVKVIELFKHYQVTASVLFQTHKALSYINRNKGNHFMTGKMHYDSLLIWYDKYAGKTHNGDYQSGFVPYPNAPAHRMKRYIPQDVPIDLEEAFS